MHLFPAKKSGWIATTSTCSSISNDGIPDIWNTILEFENLTKNNNYFFEKRKEQNQYWMLETINEQLKSRFYNDESIISLLEINKIAVQTDVISPFVGAQQLLEKYFGK